MSSAGRSIARSPRLAFAIVALTACGGSAHPAAAPGASAGATTELPPLPPPPQDPHAVPASAEVTFPDAEDDALTPPDRAVHLRARAAAREGRLADAKQMLGHLAFAYPEHTILVDQYNAVCARIAAARATAKASLEAAELKALDAPPVKYTLVRPVTLEDKVVPKLVKRSEKKNRVVDVDAWFTSNAIHTPELFVPPVSDMLFAPGTIATTTVVNLLTGFSYTEYEAQPRFAPRPLPLEIPLSYGTFPLTRAIESAPYVIAVYGDRVLAVFEGQDRVKALFDLASYVHPPADRVGRAVVGSATLTTPNGTETAELTVATHTVALDMRFALASEGVLYVQHATRSYAKVSAGQTAYISAIDIETGALAWRSAPLVANGNNFTLVRGAVVCGYGFTAEPDFVFVLDRATGATKQKIPVATGPDELVAKDSSVLVRTYDTDLVFDVR
ncbi:MAG: hypothetical protein KF894_26020 [Labilithrix sp.]|nr:hypothetical protein [Labilithrix sp.]